MCREYATDRGYCSSHQVTRREAARVYDNTTRKDDPELAWVKQQRSSARWTKLSRLFRSSFPTCCNPFKTHGEYPPVSHHVHHVVSMRQCYRSGDHEKVFEWDNLRSICTDCHNRIEGMERRDEPTGHLFDDSKPPEVTICFA